MHVHDGGRQQATVDPPNLGDVQVTLTVRQQRPLGWGQSVAAWFRAKRRRDAIEVSRYFGTGLHRG
jgi:hypothetical protein